MAHITHEQILHLAELARLRLTEEEAAKFEAELPRILEFIVTLQSAPTDAIDELFATHSLVNAFRADTNGHSPVGDPADLCEAFIAYDRDGFLVIPPIFTERSRQSDV
ncbi:MAG: Asp-tRNA(Asn)/Glu-tRNA(Gln) amidotransferase subunit GatC [Candidatus Sungbacteria bacterium]|nr:Asp-tRNA(Asn)/Glu-tRNA(Gln) amidotransferase subunit GatC [Candidatus Sungbacteria bacterium]